MPTAEKTPIAPEHCARATTRQINAKGEDTNGEKKSDAQQHTLPLITTNALFVWACLADKPRLKVLLADLV